MSTELDPQALREIAREYARRHLANLDHGAVLDEMLGDERFAQLMTGDEDQDIATLDPIAAEIKDMAKAAALSWPADQPQDAQPERDNPASDLWWSFTGGADTCYLNHDDSGSYRECCMRAGLAYALEVRDQQVRTEAQPERDGDGDVRAVAESELEAAYRKGWTDCGIYARRETDSLLDEMARDFTETGRAKREIMRRQAAALDARDAKAGDER